MSDAQLLKLKSIKTTRNSKKVEQSLRAIKKACADNTNLMKLIITAAKEYATLGEIVDAMKSEFGEWNETAIF